MDGTGSYPEPERQMEWRKEKEKCTKHMKAERDLLVIGKFQQGPMEWEEFGDLAKQ